MSEKIVQLNEEVIKGQIKELVRGSVEETLNELLEKEAESLTQTPVRGSELVLLGIFDPADGSSLQKAGDPNDCAACFTPRSDHGKGHV